MKFPYKIRILSNGRFYQTPQPAIHHAPFLHGGASERAGCKAQEGVAGSLTNGGLTNTFTLPQEVRRPSVKRLSSNDHILTPVDYPLRPLSGTFRASGPVPPGLVRVFVASLLSQSQVVTRQPALYHAPLSTGRCVRTGGMQGARGVETAAY